MLNLDKPIFDDYENIASVANRHQISKICQNLPKHSGITNICMCIIFPDFSKFFLSNVPDWAIEYHKIGGVRADNVFDPTTYQKQDYFFPRNADYDHIQKQLVNHEEEMFGYYDLYSIFRSSNECKFIFLALNKENINNIESVYTKTNKLFEKFCYEFVTKTSDIIKRHNTQFSNLLIFNNQEYLSLIMHKKYKNNIGKISPRDQELLKFLINKLNINQIAQNMCITEKSVRNKVQLLIERFYCHSKEELVEQVKYYGIV